MIKSSRKYYYYRRPIGDPLETDMPERRSIRDPPEAHWRPQHASSKPDIPDQRPMGDRHAQPETDLPVETHRRPT